MLGLLLAAGCGGGSNLGPPADSGPPARLVIVAGDGQHGTVGAPLPDPVVVEVTDAEGRPVAGVRITFAAEAGAWSPATPTTDGAGRASAAWTLGPAAGPASATAQVATLPAVSLTATAEPGAPTALAFAVEPSGAAAGRVLTPPVRVLVVDQYRNVVVSSDARIELRLDHGALLGAHSRQASAGEAEFTDLHIDEAGADYVLLASSDPLRPAASTPFDVGSGDAVRLDIAAGDHQQAAAGAAVPVPPRVIARNAAGLPVAGAAIRFAVSAGGGSVSPDRVLTGSDGSAEAAWTLGERAGDNTLSATFDDGGAEPTRFVATAVAGPVSAARSSVIAERTAVTSGELTTIRVVARDAFDNPVAGSLVTLDATGPGNTITQPGRTDADGEASGTLRTIGTGERTVTATASGVKLDGRPSIAVSYGEGLVSGVAYCTIGGVVGRLDAYVPNASFPRPLPAVIHVHGGGWVSGSRTRGVWFAPIRDRLVEEGYLVLSIDYRLAPDHRWPAQIQDTRCAVRHLRGEAATYGLDPERIGAVGSSAGGQLAALLGTADPRDGIDDVGGYQGESGRVRAVVALSPVTDFTEPEELRDDYGRVFRTWPDPDSPEMIDASPVTHVTSDDSPLFLVSGESDTLVVPAQSARMHQRLRAAGVPSTLVTIAHASHGLEPVDGALEPSMDQVLGRIVGFLDGHLR